MALCFVLDEHLRGGGLWQAIQQHNALGVDPLDMARVGDPPDLPLGTLDPDPLLWCEGRGRLLVSQDKNSLPGHLAQHLYAGRHSPGVLLIRAGTTVPQVLAALVLIAHAGDPLDYQDRIERIP
jgi:hypothetical protein